MSFSYISPHKITGQCIRDEDGQVLSVVVLLRKNILETEILVDEPAGFVSFSVRRNQDREKKSRSSFTVCKNEHLSYYSPSKDAEYGGRSLLTSVG